PLAGRAHSDPPWLHDRAGRLAAVSERRAPPALTAGTAEPVSAGAARRERRHRRTLQFLALAAALRVSARAGAGRAYGQRASARTDRGRSCAPLATGRSGLDTGNHRAGTGADRGPALRA